jgi:hypothetical protein
MTWHSGAIGAGSLDGAIGTWRGTPVQIVGAPADAVQAAPSASGALGFAGDVDVPVAGLTGDGETWEQAAAGAYLDRWTQTLRDLATARSAATGTTYLRFAPETLAPTSPGRAPVDPASFVKAWTLFRNLATREFPTAKLVFGGNSGDHAASGLSALWPGDDAVDVVGVSMQSSWQPTDAVGWKASLDATLPDGSPSGLGAWSAFAKAHGKPLAVPSWGLDQKAGTDNAAFVTDLNDELSRQASTGGSPAGAVLYDIFVNTAATGATAAPLADPANAPAAAAYRAATWGGAPASTGESATGRPGTGSTGSTSTQPGGNLMGHGPGPATVLTPSTVVVPGAITLPGQPASPSSGTAPTSANAGTSTTAPSASAPPVTSSGS